MKREEAVNRFKGIRESFSISIAQSKFYPSKVILDELCDMAIEALQAEPTDLISREEAIKEIENRIGLSWTESEANYNQGMEMALSIIEALPSVSAEKLQLSEETSTMGVDISTNTSTDLISRAELLDRIKAINSIPWGDDHGNAVKLVWSTEEVKRLIEKAPSADRPSGEWIPNHDGSWNCSECGLRVLIYAKGNYCPNCGAKMGSDTK